jgi:hypothetical protein
MASKVISYPKRTAEEILKDALPNEFLISVIDKDFEDNVYKSWTSLLEQGLVTKFRHSVRNLADRNPKFKINDIPKKTAEEGFGISGIQGNDLIETLKKYSTERGIISIDSDSQSFTLTEKGKRLMLKIDPQIE